MTDREQNFERLSDNLELDDFERLIAWTLLEDTQTPDEERYLHLGDLLREKVEAWADR
jgi:hypothetical protein